MPQFSQYSESYLRKSILNQNAADAPLKISAAQSPASINNFDQPAQSDTPQNVQHRLALRIKNI